MKLVNESYPIGSKVKIIFTDGGYIEVDQNTILDYIENEGLNVETEQGDLIGYYPVSGYEYESDVIVKDPASYLDDNWDEVIEKFTNYLIQAA